LPQAKLHPFTVNNTSITQCQEKETNHKTTTPSRDVSDGKKVLFDKGEGQLLSTV